MKSRPLTRKIPIKHWSHSSLLSFLRNQLAWYKRYVEHVHDTPATPSSFIGRAGHTALEYFYKGSNQEASVLKGLEYLQNVPDFEINFGKNQSKSKKKLKRKLMEREYMQAISFYLEKPPRHKVVAVESVGIAQVEGLPIPIKAISDLVVESRGNPGALDIVDHKFVDSFSTYKHNKTLFILQAIFNYYTVREMFRKPVKRFIVFECKKKKNKDGGPQLRKYVIEYDTCGEEFKVFHRLIKDATAEISRTRLYLPNPSDMFEGENSFDIYRLGLLDE